MVSNLKVHWCLILLQWIDPCISLLFFINKEFLLIFKNARFYDVKFLWFCIARKSVAMLPFSFLRLGRNYLYNPKQLHFFALTQCRLILFCLQAYGAREHVSGFSSMPYILLPGRNHRVNIDLTELPSTLKDKSCNNLGLFPLPLRK